MRIKRLKKELAVLAFMGLTAVAWSTPNNYQTSFGMGLWDRGDAWTGFSLWDNFSATTIINEASDASGGIVGTNTLTQPQTLTAPAGVFGGGDRIYIHDSFSSWTMDFSTSAQIQSLVLQVKESTNNTLGGLLSPVLNDVENSVSGIAFSSTSTRAAVEGADTYYFHTYVWENLTATDEFDLSFTAGPFAFSSIDGMSADFSTNPNAVPEPSSALLFLLGGGALYVFRRNTAAIESSNKTNRSRR